MFVIPGEFFPEKSSEALSSAVTRNADVAPLDRGIISLGDVTGDDHG